MIAPGVVDVFVQGIAVAVHYEFYVSLLVFEEEVGIAWVGG